MTWSVITESFQNSVLCHADAKGKRRYSSYSFLTLALNGSEWSVSHPGHALPPGKGQKVSIV
jgi:hypothetical protein